MIINEMKLRQIRSAVNRKYHVLLLQLLGKKSLPPEMLKQLRKQGLEPKHLDSFLARMYHHAHLNDHSKGPKTAGEMDAQQSSRQLPKGNLNRFAVEQLNQNFLQLIEKHRADTLAKIEGMIRDENHRFKFDFQASPKDRLETMIREKSVTQIKQRLQELSQDANRNWDRVVSTEISNAVGLGSADRILKDNEEVPADEIYVYRIIVDSHATCRWCRRFYMDGDGTPRVYRLSELLSNGSNYGKLARDWKPCVMSTHPNERCSFIMQLKPGWKVLADGTPTFVGRKQWDLYIQAKLASR